MSVSPVSSMNEIIRVDKTKYRDPEERLERQAGIRAWWATLRLNQIRSDQISHSVVSNSLQPHESQHARPCRSITNSRSSLRLTSIESVMPSSHLILCRPLLLLPPIPPSIRVFSSESTLHEVAKVLEFQLQHHSLQKKSQG